MPMEKSLEEVRAEFAADAFAVKTTGIQILEAKKGYAKVALEVGPRHKNAIGNVQGAVYFAMADFAFAVAANAFEQDGTAVVTLTGQINYLSSAHTSFLYAESAVQKDGRSAVFYSAEVYELVDGKKRLLASAQNTGFKIAKP